MLLCALFGDSETSEELQGIPKSLDDGIAALCTVRSPTQLKRVATAAVMRPLNSSVTAGGPLPTTNQKR